MADNYLNFSEVVANLTKEGRGVDEGTASTHPCFWRQGISRRRRARRTGRHEPDWAGVRFSPRQRRLRSRTGMFLGFEYNFDDDPDQGGWGRHLWVYGEDYRNPGQRRMVGSEVSQNVPPDQCWWLAYATTFSKPRVGEFGGGAIFVTANKTSRRMPTPSSSRNRIRVQGPKKGGRQIQRRKERSMSRYYEMSVEIFGHDPAKVSQIQAAAEKEWPFGDWWSSR